MSGYKVLQDSILYAFFRIGNFALRLLSERRYQIAESVGGFPVRLLNGVNVTVCRFHLRVSEPFADGLNISAEYQLHSRRCVTECVELAVRQAFTFQELAEILRRCCREHYRAVVLRKYPVIAVSSGAELQAAL